jgi:2-haloacid dehalogenase
MLNYQDFSVCTRNALDYACLYYKIALSDVEKQELMKAYRALPPFQDARAGLEEAREEGFRLYAFSNGSADAVETVLAAASIRDYFTGVVSVDDIKTFKPSPGVYSHFLRSTGSVGSDAWLISSNPFDVIGAVSFGMRAAWIRRTPDAVFDPWGIKPTITAESLAGLAERIKRECSKA